MGRFENAPVPSLPTVRALDRRLSCNADDFVGDDEGEGEGEHEGSGLALPHAKFPGTVAADDALVLAIELVRRCDFK